MTKKIYILLSRLPDRGSKLFSVISREYFTHVSIGLEEDKTMFYSFRLNGFGRENIKGYLSKGYLPYPCEVYSIDVNTHQYYCVKEEIDAFMKEDIYHYSKLGVMMSLLHIVYFKKNHYFCSYFVAEVLEKCGIVSFPKDTHLYLPKHLRKLQCLKKEYSGNVKYWCLS